MKKLETLGFKHFCMTVGNLPSSYVESLSYYECLLWLIKYLQEEVIPTVNNNSEVVEELQGLYLELKSYVDTYFDNLDVQDEINNKLDKMVEEGTLQEIIAEYLNSKAVFGFDTVSDMVSSTNLINGSYARTMGYYQKNDGGSGLYLIRDITNDDVIDNGSLIEMNDDNLVAELITNSTVNVKQFGAKGDGTTDDTTAIQNAINYCQDNNKELLFSNDTYIVTHIDITKFLKVDGLFGTIKSKDNNDSEYVIRLYYNGAIDTIFKNFIIDGNRQNTSSEIIGLKIQMYNFHDTNLKVENIRVNYCSKYGVYVTGNWYNTSVRGMYVKNLYCFKNKIGMYVDSCSDSWILESIFDHNDYYGLYLDNTGTIYISNTKAYWNGGLLNTPIDVNRLPQSVFATTSDVTPVSGKKYYTRTGEGNFSSPYRYTLFEGDSFDESTTYYEINGNYQNHGNGFYFKQCTGTYMSNCEAQDNAGDGIYSEQGNLLMLDNVGLDANGLIFDENNQVYSYSSQGLSPYFYGIFVDRTIYSQIKGYANNFRYNNIGYVQRSGIYANNPSNFNCNMICRLQEVYGIEYERIDIRNFDGIINGKSIKIPIPLSYITLNTNYELNRNNWNGSNIYVCDGILYYKLIFDNNVDKMPTTANTTIGSVAAVIRPPLIHTNVGMISTYMDEEYDVGYVTIDPNGVIRIKASQSGCRGLSISGSYIIKD